MDKVRQYLQSKNYPNHVIEGGLERLLSSWEDVGRRLGEKYEAYINYYDFLNDVDGRRILEECLDQLTIAEKMPFIERIGVADSEFKTNTVSSVELIWGRDYESSVKYSPEKNWYYFRRPLNIDDSWPERFSISAP
jgi:hypothetical protein